MAKRLIDWAINDTTGIVSMNKYNKDKDAKVETQTTFDLKTIYKGWADFNEVQKHHIFYGVKQLLADSGAGAVGDLAGKVESAKALFTVWQEGKKYAARANSTGAAETKKAINSLKEASKVISFEGLMAKKLLAESGLGEFTKDEQKKLDEFIAIMAKNPAKK